MLVHGVDGSNYQGHPDWLAVKAAGVSFVWWKATESTTFWDQTFRNAVDGARAMGIPVGAYHFARPAHTHPADQAEWFRRLCPGRLDLPAVLDYEDYLGDRRADTDWVLGWFAALPDEPTKLLYANGDALAHHLDIGALTAAGVELFYAHPATGPDLDHPPGWPPSVHQWGQGPVGGFAGPVDLDAMDETTLARYTYNPPPPQPEDTVHFHYAQTDDGRLWMVNVAATPKRVHRFADADYAVAKEGHTLFVPEGASNVGPDEAGEHREGQHLDAKGADLYGIAP